VRVEDSVPANILEDVFWLLGPVLGRNEKRQHAAKAAEMDEAESDLESVGPLSFVWVNKAIYAGLGRLAVYRKRKRRDG